MIGRGGLGKGLGALLSQEDIYDAGSPGLFQCPIEKIRPNPDQPRKHIDEESLKSLASSIERKGVLQPLVVREVKSGYELIAGERRWRAAQLAGLRSVPVVIKDVSPDEVLELALIENVQRQDLNPVEEAMAYRRLVTEFGLTQAQVAARVGKDRSTVANFLRLLQLPDYVLEDVTEGRLTMGHARALLMVSDPALQNELRNKIIKKGLSVRQAEAAARKLSESSNKKASSAQQDPDIVELCNELTYSLGSKVRIVPLKKGGRLEIKYETLDDLERIIERLRASGPGNDFS